MPKFKNPYPEIADFHCWDYKQGVQVSKEDIDRWVKETYENCLKSLNKKGFAISTINSGNSIVICTIRNFTEISYIICDSGFKQLEYRG